MLIASVGMVILFKDPAGEKTRSTMNLLLQCISKSGGPFPYENTVKSIDLGPENDRGFSYQAESADGKFVDEWNRPFKFSLSDDKRTFTITSSGIDGIFMSEDDISGSAVAK
jgi:hypothetical protein